MTPRFCGACRSISKASYPADEVQAFVASASKTKRSELIDKLIASPSYVDHWTLKWGDLLQNSRKYLGKRERSSFASGSATHCAKQAL